ncbi:hypothetical protein CR513_54699, partial [Mucuna pruriens]
MGHEGLIPSVFCYRRSKKMGWSSISSRLGRLLMQPSREIVTIRVEIAYLERWEDELITELQGLSTLSCVDLTKKEVSRKRPQEVIKVHSPLSQVKTTLAEVVLDEATPPPIVDWKSVLKPRATNEEDDRFKLKEALRAKKQKLEAEWQQLEAERQKGEELLKQKMEELVEKDLEINKSPSRTLA